ncbi:alpha-ketoglutarate-dependent dioxygenase AlkB family protein [Rhodococcus artemisiae]|uniref:Alpha-ketoglutarate-dependent dioxygenase AlkB n=1 Tax=Rhodococcus artemisiae TaxID=714159 RepID=A0ABU7LCR1_9NOCA|nr:alpha-ketoglutarate-dependent dioxygenase AlkB [Rhodococcus artemisiae]MEE2059099.1 alpha-ketoglutarate-dependent dioxygenase AlkB [Rhodococcus artemisiae]
MNEPLPLPRARHEVAPGAVHVPAWLDGHIQRRLVDTCRDWARGPAPMRHTALPGGGVMSVQTVCLGWHWSPYRYTRRAVDVDDAPVAPLPRWLADLGRRAVADAYSRPADDYEPDTALINFYDADARMGMHQDKDEHVAEPIVSLSLGDACVFRFGNRETRGRPYTDIRLESGDLFVFGGPSRFAYHGVPSVFPDSCPPGLGMTRGRLNLTLRMTGLPPDAL